jgi:hypothetical protein
MPEQQKFQEMYWMLHLFSDTKLWLSLPESKNVTICLIFTYMALNERVLHYESMGLATGWMTAGLELESGQGQEFSFLYNPHPVPRSTPFNSLAWRLIKYKRIIPVFYTLSCRDQD